MSPSILSRLLRLGCLGGLFCALLPAPAVAAEGTGEVHFDRGLLETLGMSTDVSGFEKNPSALPPGTYSLDLTLNKVYFGQQEIRVVHTAEQRQVYCFTQEQLEQWGVLLPEPAADAKPASGDCIDLPERVPQSRVELDGASGAILLTLPQAYVKQRPRNYAPPQSWDSGINAGFVSYTSNFDRSSNSQDTRNDLFLGLNGGLNLMDWRLRHNATFSHGDTTRQGSHYRTLNNYAQRDITALSSQLTLGQHFTAGDLFDSIPFSGVQLESDERMLPESERGFAPVVRGIADSNATVKIHQGQQLIHQVSVPPGPFVIDDLYNTGYTEDLLVTVIEADGREKSFSVPYSYAAELLRPGASRYQVASGSYRGEDVDNPLKFVQGGYRRGLSNNLSAYSGAVIADSYMASLIGAALNTRYGAFSLDATLSRFDALPADAAGQDMPDNGESYRLAYNKSFGGTNLQLSYRRSDKGYLGLAAAADALDTDNASLFRERDRVQLSLSQALAGGSLYLSGVGQSYWTGERRSLTFSSGFSRTFNWGSLGLSATRFQSVDGYDNQYLLSISIPLGRDAGAPRLSSTLSLQDAHNRSLQTSLSGIAGERGQWNYNLYGNHSQADSASTQSYGGNLNLRTSASALGASLARGDGFSRESLSARGSLVAYSGGIALSPSQGETMAIVEAEGAAGALLPRGRVRLDDDGKALLTGLTPYRHNEIVLDAKSASADVEIKENIQKTAPRYGAIVRVPYRTRSGISVLLELRRPGGQEVPFGAEVGGAGEVLAYVGQDNLVYLYLEKGRDSYRVSWGEADEQQCSFTYAMPAKKDKQDSYRAIPVDCQAAAGGPPSEERL